jgi:hypothetical protein
MSCPDTTTESSPPTQKRDVVTANPATTARPKSVVV